MFCKITSQTKAILTKNNNYYRSKIYEGNKVLYSIDSPLKILQDNCLEGGASLAGRKKASQNILNSASKLPVPVDPNKGIYMFPSASKKNKLVIWLAYYQVHSYESRDDITYVLFSDGSGLFVPVSFGVFDRQFKRTSQVIAQLHKKYIFV